MFCRRTLQISPRTMNWTIHLRISFPPHLVPTVILVHLQNQNHSTLLSKPHHHLPSSNFPNFNIPKEQEHQTSIQILCKEGKLRESLQVKLQCCKGITRKIKLRFCKGMILKIEPQWYRGTILRHLKAAAHNRTMWVRNGNFRRGWVGTLNRWWTRRWDQIVYLGDWYLVTEPYSA